MIEFAGENGRSASGGPAPYTTERHIDTGGLWGVEVADDADPYLNEVYAEQLGELREMLAALGLELPTTTPAAPVER